MILNLAGPALSTPPLRGLWTARGATNGLLAATLALSACGNQAAANGAAADASAGAAPSEARTSAVAPPGTGLIQGTPAGGLEDWTREIKEGTRALTAQATTNAAAAQRRALDLYVGRQEYIEMYWGPQGRLKAATPALGASVLSAETAFHDLLQLLAFPPVDTMKMRTSVDTLALRMDRVLSEAKQANVPLMPPGNEPAHGAKEPK